MRAFDAHLDRGIRDGGFDLLSSRSLSREVNIAFRVQIAERQRMSVATNYFALACPIMPLGVLGLFMLLGKLDGMWTRDHMLMGKEASLDRLSEQAREAYLLKAKQEADAKKDKTPLSCSRPIEITKPQGDKGKRRMQAEIKPDAQPMQRFDRPNLLSKRENDASKLIKQKMALQDHLEKLNGEQSYHLYCRVSAQIELLDKALKKLGS